MNNVSIEAVVFGRNDDYEPNWAGKLCASLAHNRHLFEGTSIDFRVAFVEWNPPLDKPLLAPTLVEKFPFVRVIVVDPEVHAALCASSALQVMTNFPFNVGLRTSNADFTMITCGDEFYGSKLAARIIERGLRPGCLYRAERVNVREDLDFSTVTLADLEDPKNLVSIDTCTEPPYDRPPYTNASGDFMLLDAGTMNGIRGMDESIKSARLHTDSRLATTAMIAEADCELLGQIFHINHRQTYRNNVGNYPGELYKWDVGLPYINSPDWGLSTFDWRDVADRIQRISLPDKQPAAGNRFEHPSVAVRERAKRVAARLARAQAAQQPEGPDLLANAEVERLDLAGIYSETHWDGSVDHQCGEATIQTGPVQWSYAAQLRLEGNFSPERWYWVVLDIETLRGALGVGFRVGGEFTAERYISSDGRQRVSTPIPIGADMVIFRNIAGTLAGSLAVVHSAGLASLEKRVVSEV